MQLPDKGVQEAEPSAKGRARGRGTGKGCKGNQDSLGKSAAIISVRLDVPVDAWGRLIGKGGAKLKEIQEKFDVELKVPRPDSKACAAVTVRGGRENCAACRTHIDEIVQSMTREKKAPRQASAGRPFPSSCSLCKSEVNGLKAAFSHLSGSRHISNVRAFCAEIPDLTGPASPAALATWLADPATQRAHEDLGFSVEEFIKELANLSVTQPRTDSLKEKAANISPDFDWMRVEERWFSSWDSTPRSAGPNLAFTEAPPWEEMLLRCLEDTHPPMIRIPRLPARLPHIRATSASSKKRWPNDPTSRFGLAVLAKNGRRLDEISLVSGTSLIYALAGESKYTQEVFYLQRSARTVCCLHVPSQKSWNQADMGHSVEMLLCGSGGVSHTCFYASSLVRIGDHRVLITSEVDARDADGYVAELKSTKNPSGGGFVSRPAKVAVQLACNGSKNLVRCQVNDDETQLLKVEKVSTTSFIERCRESFIYSGQRIRLLLDLILQDELVSTSAVLKLTFDEGKAPVLEIAPPEVKVLPEGFPNVQSG